MSIEEHESNDSSLAVKTRGLPEPNQLLVDILEHRGWDKRGGQVTMVEEVDLAVEEGYDAIINAPVGIGKTLGYLIGALPSDRRILICTSTKALQDQIVNSELPDLASDLKDLYDFDLTYEVIKGKGNYLCMESANTLISGEDTEDAGFFEDLGIPELSSINLEPVNALVTAVVENMALAKSGKSGIILDNGDELGMLPDLVRRGLMAKRCINHGGRWWTEADIVGPDDEDDKERVPLAHEDIVSSRTCPLGVAYAKAMKADVVVMNTSLMAAELQKSSSIESEFIASQLRGSNIIVVDEAHHLVRIITESMRVRLDIPTCIDNIDINMRRITKRRPDIAEMLNQRAKAISMRLHETAIDILNSGDTRATRGDLMTLFMESANDLNDSMTPLESRTLQSGAAIEMADIKSISRAKGALYDDVIQPLIVAATSLTKKSAMDTEDQSTNAFDVTYLGYQEGEDGIIPGLTVDLVPIDLSFFREMLEVDSQKYNPYIDSSGNRHMDNNDIDRSTLILCSGTITEEVGNILGIEEEDVEYISVKSPFAAKNMRICIPTHIPVPSAATRDVWIEKGAEILVKAVEAIGGRTMVLTTSNEMVQHFSGELYEAIPKYPIVWQGGGWTRTQMLSTKAENEESILVGTKSYWEGVNVVGSALSQVVIDKLPFPSPEDPVYNARRKFINRQGGNPFIQVDVDAVAVDLEQGIGRLRRSITDTGGVLILDPRTRTSKMYSSLVMKLVDGDVLVTEDVDKYLEWLEWVNPDNGMTEEQRPSEAGWEPLRRKRRRSSRR